MSIDELIKNLREVRDVCGGDAEVFLANQGGKTFEIYSKDHELNSINEVDALLSNDDDDEMRVPVIGY